MKIRISSRRHHYVARVSSFLIAVALIAGMIGCEPTPTLQYDLTVASTAGGSVTTPGEGTSPYNEGTVVDLVATPDEYYRFVNWTGDVSSIADVNAASTTIAMNDDYSITANFVKQYDLTISSTDGGAVTTPGEGIFAYDEGTDVDLAAVADECYAFVNWTGDSVATPGSAATTITMDVAKGVTANFVLVRYNLTIDSTDGGEVATPGEGTFAYECGTVVDLLAEAEEGYKFARWTGNADTIGDINAASTVITVNGNYSITADFVAEEAIYIADRNLEAVVRAAVHKPEGPIYPSDLELLTDLDAIEKNIADLTGLEYATRLTQLNLWDNQISDISSLANLSSLTNLNLGENLISDISPLANLTDLTWLDFENNQIRDISPVANLASLTHLDIDSNRFSVISPLANLTNLMYLDIAHNRISDISPLTNLPNLTRLEAENIGITDISPLVNLPNLTCLLIDDNEITDISPLADLTSLTGIGISGHCIDDISRVVDLGKLTWLGLSHIQISDVSPLANLTNLTTLWLRDNQISDISPLANLTGLTSLQVCPNQISDISPLANLTSLTELCLAANQISDISPLANLTKLTNLRLGNNQITDISPLVDNEGLSEGDEVYLQENPLSFDSINTYIPQLEARGVDVEY